MRRFFLSLIFKVFHKLRPKLLFNQPIKQLDCKLSADIFVDNNFNQKEISLIKDAVNDLHYFCNGLINIKLYFNLDPKDNNFIENNCVLLKADPNTPAILNAENKFKLTIVGLCNYMTNNTKRIFIIPSRLYSSNSFKATVLHELGHFICLEHTDGPSIMHKSKFYDLVFLTYIDAQEMSKVWKLNSNDFKYLKY